MNEDELIGTFGKEQVIRASGLLSLLMPQASGVGVGVKGLDGRYQLANQAMRTLFDGQGGEIVGRTDADLFPPEIARQLQESDGQIVRGAAAASDDLHLSVNGLPTHRLWLKFPVLGQDGKILSIGVVMLDIAQREAVAEMRESLERSQLANLELQKTLTELDRLASSDKLTGTWNRRRLEDAVIGEMDRLKRYDHPLSLLIIDIDFFKDINDRHGHATGDLVLVELARMVHVGLRTSDSLTRWGGEEFVVLCPNTTRSTSVLLAERLRETVSRSAFPGVGQVTVSIGVAECLSGETWDQWFQRADAALYRAKSGGRNQVQVAPETPLRAGSGEMMSANFVQLTWHAAYECGHHEVDAQHRALFAHANALFAATLSARPEDEVAALIDAFVRDVVQHFEYEEDVLSTAGFPAALEHAAIHRGLVEQAVALVERFHAGDLQSGELFQFLAHDVVARHMLGADREFFPYLEDFARAAAPLA